MQLPVVPLNGPVYNQRQASGLGKAGSGACGNAVGRWASGQRLHCCGGEVLRRCQTSLCTAHIHALLCGVLYALSKTYTLKGLAVASSQPPREPACSCATWKPDAFARKNRLFAAPCSPRLAPANLNIFAYIYHCQPLCIHQPLAPLRSAP